MDEFTYRLRNEIISQLKTSKTWEFNYDKTGFRNDYFVFERKQIHIFKKSIFIFGWKLKLVCIESHSYATPRKAKSQPMSVEWINSVDVRKFGISNLYIWYVKIFRINKILKENDKISSDKMVTEYIHSFYQAHKNLLRNSKIDEILDR